MMRSVRRWALSGRGALVGLAVLAPAVPLVVALLARRHPVWVPDLDLALTELRVRDVGGSHSPLIGLPGRIGTLERQGSHPGPISFYLLAPGYRLLGSSAFALQASTVALHLVAIGVTVGLLVRRAGARWAVAVGLALAGLVAALGPNTFTEPWNPHLPLLWWPAFLVAVWCALCGDGVALPFVVVAGAVCAQTHVSHLGAVGALTLVAVIVCLRWPDRESDTRVVRWAVGAALLAAVVWSPPVADQLRHDPGNATLLAEHLLDPPEPPVGWRDGTRLVLEHLDVAHLVRTVLTNPGGLADRYPAQASVSRGGLLLVLWAATALAARRRSRGARGTPSVARSAGGEGESTVVAAAGGVDRAPHALSALAAACVLIGITSAARIVGRPWDYLLLWLWPIGGLLVAATVVNLSRLAPPRRSDARARRVVSARPVARVRPVASAILVAVGLGLSGRAVVDAAGAELSNPVVSATVATLAAEVTDQLDPGSRYLVTWSDAVHLGAHGFGLVDELERRGIAVAVEGGLATQFGRHRSIAAGNVDGQLVVATGAAIKRWEAVPGAVILAATDERTAEQRAEVRQVRVRLEAGLAAADLSDLVAQLDENLLAVALDPRLPAPLRALVDRLDLLGARAAVFQVPLESHLPERPISRPTARS